MAGSAADAAALAERILAQGPSSYAPWLDRGPHLDLLERRALPELRAEAWRHTNVARWYEAVLHGTVTPVSSHRVESPAEVEVVDFADPRAAELQQLRGEETYRLSAQPITALNALLLGAGAAIRVPAGSAASDPIRIVDLPAAYQRILVIIEPDARVELIEEPSTYTHRLVEVVVQPGGQLVHRRHQAASSHLECSLVAVRAESGAHYELSLLSLGSDLRRNDIVASLAGVGANVTLRGAWRLDESRHLDNQVAVHHRVPGGTSRQTYRGVAADRSRAVLNGRIEIAPGAQQSDATLNTKNLLASDAAEVYAKPELEIYANDVKCSHGATVGAIDDDAVHYFRTRGIDEHTARTLFVRGFLREAIDDLDAAQMLGLIQ
ncbi:MAG: SufD family Fe-S cluster assembly protein [Gammaproteobacteria bacterium]|nr:SufD family Fe-S cluster assembly protein [Gammaproteobacteria bacterium]